MKPKELFIEIIFYDIVRAACDLEWEKAVWPVKAVLSVRSYSKDEYISP